MNEPGPNRHQLFEEARRRANLRVEELWLRYMALGGLGDVFDIDAFLHGLAPLNPTQQDVLAAAVNEQLYDLYTAACVPSLSSQPAPYPAPGQDPLEVLDRMLGHDAGSKAQRMPRDVCREQPDPREP